MRIKMNAIMIIMVIAMACQLPGECKATGNLIIPTADGDKPSRSVIVIAETGITIQCDKKIFQPFNLFDAPKQAKIIINTADVREIEIKNKENRIYILTNDSFCARYRNLFHRYIRCSFYLLMPYDEKDVWLLIFIFDNPDGTKAAGNELKKIFGEQCKITR